VYSKAKRSWGRPKNNFAQLSSKPQSATVYLDDALKAAPPPDQAALLEAALGVAHAENGEMEKAFATLKHLLASRPDSADAHFNFGLLYAREGKSKDEESAAAQFREALRLDANLDLARVALGQVLISSRNYSDALPAIQDYTTRQPKGAQGFYALGLAYQGLKKPEAAVAAPQHAALLDPQNAAIRVNLGNLLASGGKREAVIRQLKAAEQLNPSDPDVHQEHALLLEKTGDREQAHAERAKLAALKLDRDRDSAIAKFNQAASQYLSLGDAGAAEQSYRRALQLNPRDAKLHYNLSLALDKRGDFASEQRELSRTVELDPTLAVAQNALGLLALRRGQQAEAEKRFQRALAIDPTYSEAQGNLGVAYRQQAKDTEAASLFQEAIRNDPKFIEAHVNFGLLLAQRGAFPQAEQQFRAASAIDANAPDTYTALGMLQAKTGHGSDAVKSFQASVRLEPTSAQAHLNLGIAFVDQFDRPAGLSEFSEAARLDPKLAAAHYNLGRFFFETGKYEEADQELETAIRLQPDYSGTLYFLALTAKQKNQVERSTMLLEKVVAREPDNADAQYLLGQNLEHSGNRAAALQHWKAAVRAEPNHLQALFNLAKSLDKLHDPEAKQYQDRFDALQKSQQIADRVSELGNIALEAANAQNWPQALAQMDEAIQLCGNCPQSAHLHKNLGLFYGRTGNIGEAKKELRTALQLAPNDAEAQNSLAMLERAPEEQVK
jgi:tetratricopeptide (TPR) repeat protein